MEENSWAHKRSHSSPARRPEWVGPPPSRWPVGVLTSRFWLGAGRASKPPRPRSRPRGHERSSWRRMSSDYDAVDRAASQAENELGPLDVWVNNAMTTSFSPLSDTKPEDFRRAIEVTFLGQVWGTMAALERMRTRDRGNIVNVGSALAFIGIPLQSPYCSAKFACRGFFESTRAELLHEGSHVRLSMVHLPAVNTPQFDWCQTTMDRHPQPVPPIYQPEIPAKFIVQAALDGRRSKVIGSWNKLLVAARPDRSRVGKPLRGSRGVGKPTRRPADRSRPTRQPATIRPTTNEMREPTASSTARLTASLIPVS